MKTILLVISLIFTIASTSYASNIQLLIGNYFLKSNRLDCPSMLEIKIDNNGYLKINANNKGSWSLLVFANLSEVNNGEYNVADYISNKTAYASIRYYDYREQLVYNEQGIGESWGNSWGNYMFQYTFQKQTNNNIVLERIIPGRNGLQCEYQSFIP